MPWQGEGRAARDVLTRPAFENALRVLRAQRIDQHTVVRLLAFVVARACMTPDDFDRIARQCLCQSDCKPVNGYVEDFIRVTMPVLLKAMESQLDLATVSVTGQRLAGAGRDGCARRVADDDSIAGPSAGTGRSLVVLKDL